MNPLNARWHFWLRTPINWIIVLFILIFSVFLFSESSSSWIFIGATIAGLFCLYFFVLDKRTIGIRCNHCRKYIATNTPWICGFCQAKNESVDDFPFAYQCEHCGAEPKAYKCHHKECGKLIFLSEDQLEENYARCIGAPAEDKTMKNSQEREEQRRAKEHEIFMADLEEKLAAYTKRKEPPKKPDPQKEIVERIRTEFNRGMGAEKYARELRKAIDEEYKDDPDLREKAHLQLNEALRQHGT